MISTLIYNAKFGDKLAMEQLLHKFHPLLKKYANKLKYVNITVRRSRQSGVA